MIHQLPKIIVSNPTLAAAQQEQVHGSENLFHSQFLMEQLSGLHLWAATDPDWLVTPAQNSYRGAGNYVQGKVD